MNDTILVSLITGGVTLIGTVVSVMMANRLTNYRIGQLEAKFDRLEGKVEKHNNLVERLAVVERDVKTAFRLIDDNRDDRK